MAVDLSLVVPAYNEAHRLPLTLPPVIEYLERTGRSYEIIVVDDGSTDRTAEVAGEQADERLWVLELAKNRGKGAALRYGVVASSGDRVLISDADFSTPIEELEKLEPRLERAEVVMGSRDVPDARVELRQSPHRELLGKGFNVFLRLLGVWGLRDTQCGFKLLRGPVAREIFPELVIDRFAYDVELVIEARRRGYRVEEVGVVWRDADTSNVRVLHDGIRMVRDVLRARLRSWRPRR